MKTSALAALLLLAVVGQVSVAPLFPVAGAVADFPLVALALLAALSGPRAAMVAIPLVAVLAGLVSDRAPGLMLLGYVPLLPLGAWLEETRVPIGSTFRLFAATLGTGLWLRALLAVSASMNGAELPWGTLVGDVLIPGAFLDLAFLGVVYAPLRLLGWEAGRMTLRRGAY